jgi:hypothetical protein
MILRFRRVASAPGFSCCRDGERRGVTQREVVADVGSGA